MFIPAHELTVLEKNTHGECILRGANDSLFIQTPNKVIVPVPEAYTVIRNRDGRFKIGDYIPVLAS